MLIAHGSGFSDIKYLLQDLDFDNIHMYEDENKKVSINFFKKNTDADLRITVSFGTWFGMYGTAILLISFDVSTGYNNKEKSFKIYPAVLSIPWRFSEITLNDDNTIFFYSALTVKFLNMLKKAHVFCSVNDSENIKKIKMFFSKLIDGYFYSNSEFSEKNSTLRTKKSIRTFVRNFYKRTLDGLIANADAKSTKMINWDYFCEVTDLFHDNTGYHSDAKDIKLFLNDCEEFKLNQDKINIARLIFGALKRG